MTIGNPSAPPSLTRRLYDWTVHWSETPHAVTAMVVISFAASIFFPIPPDVLLISLCFARPDRWISHALLCTVASVAGGMVAWVIGAFFWQATSAWFYQVLPGFSPEKFATLEHLFRDYGFLIIVAKNLTPIPYKVVAVAAGVFRMNPWELALASFLSRGLRYLLTAGMIRLAGPRIRPHLERNLELAAVLMAIGLVLGFLLLKFL